MVNIENLTFGFLEKNVINNVNFSFENKIYVLLGDNGCGKTTLFRCITGYYSNYSGHIKKDEAKLQNVGYLPQKFGLYKNLSVTSNLKYLACLREIDDVNNSINSVINQLNLEKEKNIKAGKLSGGMLQRLGIAQAILGDPEILLLDEPTVGLDIGQRSNFYDMIKRLQINCPIIISTHIPDDVKNIADEVIVMREGRLYYTRWDAKKDNIEEKYLCFRG